MRVRETGGFSLAEVLLALFILAIALLGLAKLQIRNMEAADYTGRKSIALALAQDKIEEFQNMDFSSIASGEDENPITVRGSGEGESGTTYTRSWTVVENGDDTWGANTKTVTVTVSWGPKNRQVTLSSIISP